jgi:hypothetical protein
MASFDARFGDVRTRIAGLDAKLDALLARPPCTPSGGGASPKTVALDAAVTVPSALSAQPQLRGPAPPDAGRM